MKRTYAIVAVVVALLVAAASFYFWQRQPPRPSNYSNVIITMERTMCLGTCPVYELTIYGDGRVVYNGHQHVEVTGIQTSNISPDSVRELIDEFYRIGYFSLRDEYRYKWSFLGFGVRITDAPTTITSITVDGRVKQVVEYDGAPQKLIELEDKIDETADTQRWIGNPESLF